MALSRRTFVEFLLAGVSTTFAIRHGHAEAANGAGIERLKQVSPSSAVSMPKGYRKPGHLKWGWGAGKDGILPNWQGGSGTQFDPSFIDWHKDRTATLRFDNVDGVWTAGELQIMRSTRPISQRWGAMLSSERPSAVCALFAYAKDGTEIDFEWRGDQVWQLNLHLFDEKGNRINPSPIPTVAVDVTKPHVYEFSMDAQACLFMVDGKEVARISPEDMPHAIWKSDAAFELFVSIEHHGAWAKHDYAGIPATMTVHGVLI